ncbi:hypothetical protein [Riemerella columbina]|uniref:hypothetical protein n=1 Tax=Riemerella columbina TaxID=103810 RepID=UPI000375EC3A|nr:hypothetical protein [Riemerella columbina]
MESFVLILFILLLLSLPASVLGKGYFKGKLLIYRNIVTGLALVFFSYWLFKSSVVKPLADGLALQLVNKHSEPMDFYSIEVYGEKNNNTYQVQHLGDIRPEHYRVEYLSLKETNEFWLIGYSKKKVAYFTQHVILNKNEDCYIEAANYLNQSTKLSLLANKEVQTYKKNNSRDAVWVVLSLLIVVINLILFFRKRK